ncbi:hypothetical protein BZZ01_07985 [Nostocales cyanobacterium HT-58-2]|nr:hypothetical protein BZZ01_07985 [Nostocales cyanobacterium HT-58-2]
MLLHMLALLIWMLLISPDYLSTYLQPEVSIFRTEMAFYSIALNNIALLKWLKQFILIRKTLTAMVSAISDR